MKVRPKNPYLCPICMAPISRLDYKTCGASDCLAQWRLLTSRERTDLLSKAAEYAAKLMNQIIDDSIQTQMPSALKKEAP